MFINWKNEFFYKTSKNNQIDKNSQMHIQQVVQNTYIECNCSPVDNKNVNPKTINFDNDKQTL